MLLMILYKYKCIHSNAKVYTFEKRCIYYSHSVVLII